MNEDIRNPEHFTKLIVEGLLDGLKSDPNHDIVKVMMEAAKKAAKEAKENA